MVAQRLNALVQWVFVVLSAFLDVDGVRDLAVRAHYNGGLS